MVIAVAVHKLAYMALPKAGCSSVKEALARIDPDAHVPPQDQIDINTWHKIYPTQRFRPHRWEAYRGHWRFCVVRDPIKRLMSLYTDIVAGRQELHHSPRLRRSDLPLDPDPDMFFQNLFRYRALSSLVKHHALGAWLFLGPDLRGSYDAVYRTEDLGALAKALSSRVGQPVDIPRRNTSQSRLDLSDLHPRTVDVLRPFLQQEYDFLSEFYDNPFGGSGHDACVTQSRCVS